MIKNLSESQIEIEISVTAEELEKFLDLAAEEFSKDIKIDGFRPGKAPRKIIEQKVGAEKLLAHAAEKAIKKYYVDSVVKNKIEAIGEPKITITKIAPGNALEFKAVIDVMPKITLGNYRKQAKSAPKTELREIKSAEIQKELEILQKRRAKLVTVLREAKKGDRVEIDFQVSIDGKEIEGGSSKNHPLSIGENYFISGFEDRLIGMKEQEEKEFDLAFPKDYHKKELSGKLARFRVKINLVQEKELPEINDRFAQSLGDFESLEKMKGSIREGLAMEQKKKNKDKWRSDVMEKIISEIKIEIPDTLANAELEKMMSEFEGNIMSMGMNLDQYLESINKTRDEIKADWKAAAQKRILSALALREIARLENIFLDNSEIEEEMNKTLAYYKNQGDLKKNVDMEKLYEYVKGVMANEKVFKFLESL